MPKTQNLKLKTKSLISKRETQKPKNLKLKTKTQNL